MQPMVLSTSLLLVSACSLAATIGSGIGEASLTRVAQSEPKKNEKSTPPKLERRPGESARSHHDRESAAKQKYYLALIQKNKQSKANEPKSSSNRPEPKGQKKRFAIARKNAPNLEVSILPSDFALSGGYLFFSVYITGAADGELPHEPYGGLPDTEFLAYAELIGPQGKVMSKDRNDYSKRVRIGRTKKSNPSLLVCRGTSGRQQSAFCSFDVHDQEDGKYKLRVHYADNIVGEQAVHIVSMPSTGAGSVRMVAPQERAERVFLTDKTTTYWHQNFLHEVPLIGYVWLKNGKVASHGVSRASGRNDVRSPNSPLLATYVAEGEALESAWVKSPQSYKLLVFNQGALLGSYRIDQVLSMAPIRGTTQKTQASKAEVATALRVAKKDFDAATIRRRRGKSDLPLKITEALACASVQDKEFYALLEKRNMRVGLADRVSADEIELGQERTRSTPLSAHRRALLKRNAAGASGSRAVNLRVGKRLDHELMAKTKAYKRGCAQRLVRKGQE